MSDLQEPIEEWQQHYPTHRISDKEIVRKEYEASSQSVQSQERVFANAVSVLVLVLTLAGSWFGLEKEQITEIAGVITQFDFVGKTFVVLIPIMVVLLTARYFAERQKTIVFDSRKVVVLRVMLGLRYGKTTLVLPNWRLEGADNPFAIRMFPGWFAMAAFPYWILTIASGVVLLPLTKVIFLGNLYSAMPNWIYFGLIGWFVALAALYRYFLYDIHETYLLSFAKFLAHSLNLRLEKNFEYIIYRAKLAVHEARRTKTNLEQFKPLLVFVEDRNFVNHHGISFKGMARAVRDRIMRGKRSGGSTITQQLARSLFVHDLQKSIRRKIIEVFLAFWVESQFTKDEIIEIYISSVRFATGVNGLNAAAKHFFDKKGANLTNAEMFFLVERISNIRNRILVRKVNATLSQAVSAGILTFDEAAQVRKIYAQKVAEKILVPDSVNEFEMWTR